MFFFNKNKTNEKIRLEYIEIQIVNHCNLRCKGCTHFANIAEPYFITVEEFERNIIELSNKFDIKIIRLLGGEPLLHPEIIKLAEIARKYLKKSTISITTNGLLLAEQNELFWRTLQINNIIIDVSLYPIHNEIYEKSFRKMEENNIEYYVKKTDYFSYFTNINAAYNKKSSFNKCPIKYCIIVSKNRIYHCPITACLYIYNEKFHTRLKDSKGISIYSNSKQIMKYLNKPIETCKYCCFGETSDKVKYKKWELSKQQPDEWY